MGLRGMWQNTPDGHLPGIWHPASQALTVSTQKKKKNSEQDVDN